VAAEVILILPLDTPQFYKKGNCSDLGLKNKSKYTDPDGKNLFCGAYMDDRSLLRGICGSTHGHLASENHDIQFSLGPISAITQDVVSFGGGIIAA
jgi:hypothetical protein